METHLKLCAVLHIIIGSLGMITFFLVLLLMGGLNIFLGMFSSVPDASLQITLVTVVGLILSAYIFLSSIPGLVAGIGLLKHANWARILTIIVSILYIPFHFPLGTILGIYSLWVMFTPESMEWFQKD